MADRDLSRYRIMASYVLTICKGNMNRNVLPIGEGNYASWL